MSADFVLYGAYGYTGELITRFVADYGLRPLLAGRNADKLRELAEPYGYDYCAVSLEDESGLRELLAPYPVVLHAAGPFKFTAAAMHRACLHTETHYLDITGEIEAFAAAQSLDQEAKERHIMMMPGVGFDVVPTDCLAAFLKQQLPTATDLKLAFAWKGGGVSHGTAMTMLESLGQPGAVRRQGKITPVPPAYKTAEFPFTAQKSLRAVTIPWGDVFTAFHTTGIGNIETYFAAPPTQQKFMKWSRWIGPLLRLSLVKNLLRRQVAARPAGPSDQRREQGEAYVYGEATNNEQTVRARLKTPEGYTLTAITALMITQRVLNQHFRTGYQTPASVYGADFILEVAGKEREVLE
ncbi:trans-acting enoyl reductase family protein [Lewinella sp. W8]|uniref:saccharopine dehydrogenase family protein n=1 Tax=Lewinella sp. W8 TaxID=2528208 RepID=UPI001068236C|nr:saccharopine dehydrogenase NADP-binding domain-containing protein [Lewinella sp. W8]MTB50248.1 hypothetical protein [Lewinella sp. W8]